MKKFIVRDGAGSILRTGVCPPSDLPLQAGVGEFVDENLIDGLTDENHYHNGAAYSVRDDMGITVDKTTLTADNLEIATFSNIPVGTMVEGTMVNDGTLEFTTNSLGKNLLTFVKVPRYKPQVFNIVGV